MKLLRAFIASMTGRMFFLLVGGMVVAAVIAGFASNFNSSRVLKRQADERAADQLLSFINFVENAPPEWRTSMQRMNGPGIQIHTADTAGGEPDPSFTKLLAARGGVLATATAEQAAPDKCFAARGGRSRGGSPWNGWPPGRRGGWGNGELRGNPDQAEERFVPPECRLVSVTLGDGTPLRLSVEAPGGPRSRSRLLDPAFMILFGAGIVVLALLAALRASAPLRRLAQASTQLGQDLHREPLAVAGPSEMRQAITAFNSMQARLQTHVAERTQMLAAITHDLQTPLTRLRLRLERVEDAELRERLVADMQSMRALIDEGLELARTAETPEAVVMLDLDSVLESLVEDAVEAGLAAEFTGGCGAVLPLRPLATRRVFANLIDNALVHGGSAEVRAVRDAQSVCVFVRDRGPGIPEDLLERVFDPFFRPDNSRSRETGGTGLGLTIARMLATKIGATLKLRNHPQGGVEAEVRWDSPVP
jgi:signal transduction histidine kinase